MINEIHQKIKEMRLNRKLTLKELSQKTELSTGFLSMIERGSSSLTITSLKKIADAFEVDISYFFEKPVTNSNYYIKKSDQKKFQIEGSETGYIRLGGNFSSKSLEPLVVVLKPNQQKDFDYSHTGEEFYYVLKGVVQFKVGDVDYEVKEGESIHFPSHIPHDYENPLDQEAVMICVLTPILF